MGRTLNGTTEFLRIASALGLTAPPFTMSCFYASNDLAVNQTLISIGNDASQDAHYLIFRHSGDIIGAASGDQGIAYGESQTSAGLVAGFNHCAGIWTSDSNRQAGLNAAFAAANGTTVTPDSIDEINIGRYSATVGSYMNGNIASVALWSVALTGADIAMLNNGFPPRRVRPQSLVFYAPLLRDVQDIRGAATFATATGSAASHHRAYGV